MLSYHVAQASACERPRSPPRAPPTTSSLCHIHNFGVMLEPRWIVGTESLDQ
jgi:hypothetical protein